MNGLSKLFTTVSIFFAAFIFSILAFSIWKYAQKSSLYSCVYSVGSDVVEYSTDLNNFAKSSYDWYVLTDEEAKLALKSISFKDCTQSNSPQDFKEKNFKIAVKKTGDHSYAVMVWSKGFDNISGTEDDIIFPSGKKIPN